MTGKPIFGVEERPRLQGDVPTEWYSPTQPFPVKPPPVTRVSMTVDDLVTAADTTPEHAQACRELWDKTKFYTTGPYTYWKYKTEGNPPALIYPGTTGGPNWGGTAVDTKLNYIFVNSKDAPQTGWIQKNPKYQPGMDPAKEFPYIRVSGPGFNAPVKDANGRTIGNWPCSKPPWARLVPSTRTPETLRGRCLSASMRRCRPVNRTSDLRASADLWSRRGTVVYRRDHRQPIPRI